MYAEPEPEPEPEIETERENVATNAAHSLMSMMLTSARWWGLAEDALVCDGEGKAEKARSAMSMSTRKTRSGPCCSDQRRSPPRAHPVPSCPPCARRRGMPHATQRNSRFSAAGTTPRSECEGESDVDRGLQCGPYHERRAPGALPVTDNGATHLLADCVLR